MEGITRRGGKKDRKFGRKLRRDSFRRYWVNMRWWRRKTERMVRHVAGHPNDAQSADALSAWKARPKELTIGTQMRRYGSSGTPAWTGGKAQNYAPGK